MISPIRANVVEILQVAFPQSFLLLLRPLQSHCRSFQATLGVSLRLASLLSRHHSPDRSQIRCHLNLPLQKLSEVLLVNLNELVADSPPSHLLPSSSMRQDSAIHQALYLPHFPNRYRNLGRNLRQSLLVHRHSTVISRS